MINNLSSKNRAAFYIAEIGLNHNGDPAVAEKMIGAAADAGADAVKFQTFVPELMNSPYTKSLLETGREGETDSGVIDFLRNFVLQPDDYRALQRHASDLGLVFFSSPFDLPSVELLKSLDVPLYKIASSEVTNHALITAVAKTGKPAVMSTGIAAEEEISMAIRCFSEHSNADFALMHCVSLYPVENKDVNLLRITSLAQKFGIPVGFSDHTRGTETAPLAAALGARLFEKHFTVDRNHKCPDKDVSLDPEELSRLINAVENAIAMMGTGEISFGTAEEQTARAARRSLFAKHIIRKGNQLKEDDVVSLRPGTGISPVKVNELLDRTACIDIPEGRMLRYEYFK